MNKKDLHLYTTIGQIHSNIIRAASFEEAVITGLKTILSSGIADYSQPARGTGSSSLSVRKNPRLQISSNATGV